MSCVVVFVFCFFFFEQKTAYGWIVRDWSSEVCSSDRGGGGGGGGVGVWLGGLILTKQQIYFV
jgi:hypothetical protein